MNRLPIKSKGPIRVEATSKRRRDDPESVLEVTPAELPPASAQPPRGLLKLLRFKAVQERTGLSRSTIWRLEQRGAFPRHRRISDNAVAWVEEEVILWIASKVDDIAV